MTRKIALGLLWLGFVVYAFLFAPPNQPDTLALIQNLSTGKWEGINPLVIALFNLMGVLPMVYACLILIDGRVQKIPAWLFVTTSLGVGAFALLPYLALRESNGTFVGEKSGLLKIVDSRWTGLLLALAGLALFGYGVAAGDWSDFVQQWQTSRFIHVMSLDFCVLCLVFPALLRDDMARRGLNDDRIFWAVSLLPFFGPLAYLVLRPPLKTAPAEAPKRTAGKGFGAVS